MKVGIFIDKSADDREEPIPKNVMHDHKATLGSNKINQMIQQSKNKFYYVLLEHLKKKSSQFKFCRVSNQYPLSDQLIGIDILFPLYLCENYDDWEIQVQACQKHNIPMAITFEQQDFINNKYSYMKLLQENNFSCIDTTYIRRNQFVNSSGNIDHEIVTLLCSELLNKYPNGVILKPSFFGGFSSGFSVVHTKDTDTEIYEKIKKANINSKTGLFIQPLISEFRTSFEIKTVWFNGVYKSSYGRNGLGEFASFALLDDKCVDVIKCRNIGIEIIQLLFQTHGPFPILRLDFIIQNEVPILNEIEYAPAFSYFHTEITILKDLISCICQFLNHQINI